MTEPLYDQIRDLIGNSIGSVDEDGTVIPRDPDEEGGVANVIDVIAALTTSIMLIAERVDELGRAIDRVEQ